MKVRTAVVLFFSLSTASLAADTAPTGRLRGEVHGIDRKPVAGATTIAVRDQAPPALAVTTTDSAGFLAIDRVPLGSWDVTVLAPGFTPGVVLDLPVGGPFRAVADIVLKRGEGAFATLPLPGATDGPGTALVQVTDDKGQPLARVRVLLEPLGHRADPALVETDAAGTARVPAFAPGRWRLSILRAGWARLVVPDVTLGGGEVTVIARLLPLADGAAPPLDELLPPPRLITE